MKRVLLFLVWAPAAALSAAATVPCNYVAQSGAAAKEEGFDSHPGCAVMNSDGTLTFDPAHLARMLLDADGLARVFAADRWFYVRPNGDALEVVAWDNGPDEFSQERVRTVRAGKLGYSDRSFRAVVPPTFDWGWPFEDGRALVCRGCVLDPPDGDGHRTVSGGLWGYIDLSGQEIVPLTLSREAARLLGRQN